MKKLVVISFGVISLLGQERAVTARPTPLRPGVDSAKKKSVSQIAVPPTSHLDDVAKRLGLTSMEYGHIEKEEDERLFAKIHDANSIKILVSNGYNLVNNLKAEFTEFLNKPGSSMQVIFATADSDFYREETEITLGLKPGEDAYTKNLGLVALDRGRLEGYASAQNQNHLSFRYFDTQFRLPIIIIDNKYCYMTIRLSPNESSQSLRMEFDQGYAKSCLAHFDRMWALSSPSAESNRWLTALGLASWSRTELMALVACIGTLLAGMGAFLAVPPVQRLLRLEKRLEIVSPSEKGIGTSNVSVGVGHNANQRTDPDLTEEQPSSLAPKLGTRANKRNRQK